MKILTLALGLFALAGATAGQAAALNIPRNAKVVSADGREIGLVNRVLTSGEDVTGIRVIIGSRSVTVGADKLSLDGEIVKTSLTKKEVERLP
ncbi:hypothetical protein VVT58_19345 (plasmid) [Sphingobium sp. SJ10-10]|uniref:hypothetical protein n=1 Tax=Sphingobium sp. SJ10-10 TaxID=3114999 RepID=UPI002E189005|nr:hypothetical protein [Sphingobium sp. SJ10-10]